MIGIDAHAVARSLGMSGPLTVTLIAAKQRKRVWRVEAPEGTFALKVLRPDKESTAEREQKAMDAARISGLPVPAVRATGTWEKHPAMLLSWCPGHTVQAELRSRPWAAYGLGLACGRTQAQLHRVLAPPSEGSWVDGFGPIDAALRVRLLSACDAAPRLLHMDYHPQNLIVQGGEITGVIDWSNATAGDPRADLARTWTLLVVLPALRRPHSRARAMVRWLLATGWHKGYEQVAGPQTEVQLFRAWAVTTLLHSLRYKADNRQEHVDIGRLRDRLSALSAGAGVPRRLAATGDYRQPLDRA